jgi:hypothetical protein
MIERQGRADDDNTDRDHIRDFFAAKLVRCKLDPNAVCIFIPSIKAAEWLSEATRKHFETNKSSAHINGLGIPELIQNRESKQRGFIWLGINDTTCKPTNINEIEEDIEQERNANFEGRAWNMKPKRNFKVASPE